MAGFEVRRNSQIVVIGMSSARGVLNHNLYCSVISPTRNAGRSQIPRSITMAAERFFSIILCYLCRGEVINVISVAMLVSQLMDISILVCTTTVKVGRTQRNYSLNDQSPFRTGGNSSLRQTWRY